MENALSLWIVIVLCIDQLMTLQSKLTEREQEMKIQIHQLTIQHEMNIRQLQAEHDAEIDRIRAGKKHYFYHFKNF